MKTVSNVLNNYALHVDHGRSGFRCNLRTAWNRCRLAAPMKPLSEVSVYHDLWPTETPGRSVQSKPSLAKGRIAVLSSFAAANAFVRQVCWAGTFARGGRRTTRNVFMPRYVTMG